MMTSRGVLLERYNTGAPGVRWRVRLYSGRSYIGSQTFAKKSDAQWWEAEQKRKLALGTYTDPRLGRQSVREWAVKWVESLAVAPRTKSRYESLLRHHVVPEFGRQPVASVRLSEVQTFANRLSEIRSTSTARQAVGVLRQVCEYARADGAIHVNPTHGVKLRATRPGEPEPLTDVQVWTLVDAVEAERDKVLVAALAYTGLRWGEVSALRIGDYRRSDRRLYVARAYSDDAGALRLGPVKDHAARSVVLPDVVGHMVEDWLDGEGAGDEDDLIFGSRTGSPLRNGNWSKRVLAPASASVGRKVTPHHFRDTAASLAISHGASVMAIARMLGHEDASVTLRHYAKLFPSEVAEVATALNEGIIAARNPGISRAIPGDPGRSRTGTDSGPTSSLP